MIANQNAHAFSPEFHRDPCKSSDKSQVGRRTTWISGDKTTVQLGDVEREKSGYIPTNTFQFTEIRLSKTHDRHTMDRGANSDPSEALTTGSAAAKASLGNGL